MKSKDKKLVAKTVFGEITLRDLVGKFGDDILMIHVYSEDSAVDCISKGWSFDEDDLYLHGTLDIDFTFDLDTKVLVQDERIKFEHEGDTYLLTFLGPVKFDAILPSKGSSKKSRAEGR